MTAELAVRYERAPLYPKQEAALFNDARYCVVEASTKSGKTVGCIVWIHEQAALNGGPGRHFWWIAPISRVAKIAFRRLQNYLPAGSFTANKTDMTVTLANGSVIQFLGAENPDFLYGEDVYAAVIDEATRVKVEAWFAIRSTLTATRGSVRIIGNVKGRKNWAYRLARRAEMGVDGYHYAKLTVWDAVEAGIFPIEEAEDAKDILPEAVFRELYLAEPGDDGEAFFQIDKIVIVEDWPRHAKVARMWDYAATEEGDAVDPDYTVGVKLAHDGRMTYVVDVIRQRAAPERITRIVTSTAAADGPNVHQVIEQEKGSSGKIMVSLFRQLLNKIEGTGKVHAMPVTGSKVVRAFHFAAACNEGSVVLVKGAWNDLFLEELDVFPDGQHDDQVDGAVHGYNHLVPHSSPRVRFL